MRLQISCILTLLFLATSRVEPKRSRNNNNNVDFTGASCDAYDRCLQAYDNFLKSCGSDEEKEDEFDSCYGPIARQQREYAEHKEERNRLLRRCYSEGTLEEDAVVTDDSKGGKRNKSSCVQKLYEMEEFLSRQTEKAAERLRRRVASSYSSCKASAKRVKERCGRIESCCPRIKQCRRLLSKHEIMEQLRRIENDMKQNRRKCRETSKND